MSSVEPDEHTPWAQQTPTPVGPPVSPTSPTPPPPRGPHVGYAAPASYTTAAPDLDAEPDADPRVASFGQRLVLVALATLLAVTVLGVLRGSFNRSWDPVLEPYVAYVEAERGLSFTKPVDVRWADIAAEVRGNAPEETLDAADDPWAQTYALLGLVDPNPEVSNEESLTETLSENAGAFYDRPTETIVLPEGANEIELSVTIVHELTHALQDQNGMLGGSKAFESPDDFASRRVLIEGDAERIAVAWYWDQPEAFRDQYLEAIGADPDARPEDPGDNFLFATFLSSYEIGLPMVETIIETEGQAGLDELLRSKNTGTTERLIDPFGDVRQPEVDAIAEMTLPDGADGVIGDLGPLTLFQALAPTIGTAETFDALIGYDNDAFAMFERDGTTCARLSIFFESRSEGTEFIDILNAADVPGDRALASTEVIFDVCEPIGSPEFQRVGTIVPIVVVQEAARDHVNDGVPLEKARCAAIAQASTIPADQPATEFVGRAQLSEQRAQFLADC